MRARTVSLLLTLVCAPVMAQQTTRPAPPAGELVDRIVALVGDSVIFDSELQELLALLEQQGQRIPRDDSAALRRLKRQLIDERVESLILLQAAQRDTTIKPNEQQIGAQVDNIINQRRQAIGGQAAFDQALRQQGFTFQEYRDVLLQDVRKQQLIQQFLAKVGRDRKPPPITEQRLKAIYDSLKAAGRLPARQASVTFRHIVLPPRASDSARAVARAKADSIFTMVKAGQDFIELAKRYTEEPGGKERGGDLGWARPETYVKEFADAVAVMRPGDVVGPVETMFGFHIIKVEKVRGAERQVRHILIKPETSEGDDQRMMERGKQVADQIRAGANVDSLAQAVGSTEQRVQVEIARERLQQVSPAYAQELANARKGDVVGPFLLRDQAGGAAAAIVKVDDVKEAGEQSWDDPGFRAVFRSQIDQQRLIAEVIEELRRQTHVEIRL